jgi:hypothetical protein
MRRAANRHRRVLPNLEAAKEGPGGGALGAVLRAAKLPSARRAAPEREVNQSVSTGGP